MSNKPAVSWSQLSGFGGNIENLDTAFSEGVGGAYFDVGTHKDVSIAGVEPKQSAAGNFYINLTLKGAAEETIYHRVMLGKKEGAGFHFSYQKLASALIQDPDLRMRTFGRAFAENPALLDSLKGLKLTITVAKGSEGYVVEDDGLGGKVIINVATGKEYDDPQLVGKRFTDYTEIKDITKELSIKRMYNEVKNVSKGSEEAVVANEETLSAVLRSVEASAAPKAATTSRAARPRASI